MINDKLMKNKGKKERRQMDVGLGLIFFNLPSLMNIFSLHISSSLHLFSTPRQYSVDFDKALWLQTT